MLQLAKGVESLIVFAVHKVKICYKQERLFQPLAGGCGLTEFIYRVIESVIVASRPCGFRKNVESLGSLIRARIGQVC